MLIDTHCHLDFSQFDLDRAQVIKRSKDEGVNHIINVGVDVQSSERSVELAQAYPHIFAAVGIHPHYAQNVKDADILRIEELSSHKKVAAIGEVGLDFYDRDALSKEITSKDKEAQRRILTEFINLARKKRLPIIFHCRQAADDILEFARQVSCVPLKAVVHCFSFDESFLDKCLNFGLYVSFTANITYKKSQALRELVGRVPIERLLLETDAPFLAAQAFRGMRNEPAFVRILAQEIAKIKNISFEEVAEVTTNNARDFFSIK